MDVHKPKGLHSWRDLVKEVAIIVLGVLIALGAEQAVQAMEWRQKVAAAEAAMRSELSSDDGPQVWSRYALHACVDGALAAIREGVEKGAGREAVLALIAKHQTPFWTWDSLAFNSANTSEVALHMPTAAVRRWGMAYATIEALNQANAKEFSDGADLVALSRTGGPLTEAERGQVLRAVEVLRRDNAIIFASVRVALPFIDATGVRLDPATMDAVQMWGERSYGKACQVTPPVK